MELKKLQEFLEHENQNQGFIAKAIHRENMQTEILRSTNIEDKFGISIQVKKKELVKGKAEINELENKTALINEKPVFSFNNKIKQQLP